MPPPANASDSASSKAPAEPKVASVATPSCSLANVLENIQPSASTSSNGQLSKHSSECAINQAPNEPLVLGGPALQEPSVGSAAVSDSSVDSAPRALSELKRADLGKDKAMSIPPGILPLESDFTIAVNFPGAEISYTNGAHSLANGNLLSAPEHNKPKLNTPKQPVSGTLNGTVAGGIRFSEAKVRSRVRAALDVLSILKQEVIRLLYGLDAQDQADQGPRTHAEVAEILSAALSAPQRWVIARERGIQPEQVRISAEEVKLLETQALRDVRPNRMRSSDAAPDPLSNPFFTGKFGASNN